MSEEPEAVEAESAQESGAETPTAPPERERMPPLESRFLFVDVASRRAKQLRRGALPRLAALASDPETGERPTPTQKLERIAMAEVDEGLVVYELPEPKVRTEDAS